MVSWVVGLVVVQVVGLVGVQVVSCVGKGSLSVLIGFFQAREHSALKVLYCIVGTIVLGSWFQLRCLLSCINTKVGSCIHPQFFEANIP